MAVSVVTCVTGSFNRVHKTDVENAYVFTTIRDDSFKKHCEEQGWGVIIMNEMHTFNLKEATRQSKYIKTLKYCNVNTEHVLYIDHKYKIMSIHIPPLIKEIGDNAFLSFINPKSIYREFFDSMAYDRYLSDIIHIRANIDDYRDSDIQLFYGGLILYNTRHKDFVDITNKMNRAVDKYKHVQDQILFPTAINEYKKILINNTIGLKHECPQEQIPGKTY